MTSRYGKDALLYHSDGRAGKIQVIPTKPYLTQQDLALAYTPGVAQPCLEIKNNSDDIYKYTATGNLVGVISNGTAVLGLGDIGAKASKPVMEGKGLLFKVFADIDVFDIEINEKDPVKLVEIITSLAPTFGGINLEDIKAPECFYVERKLKERLDIPVMHDDQHGTAIISAAGLLNAAELAGKKLSDIRVVVCGAGASATSCIKMYQSLGVHHQNISVFDSKGCIHKGRNDLTPEKQEMVTDHFYPTLDVAIKGCDMILGLSVAGQISKAMIKSMAPNPIVFVLANPVPEISWEDAHSVRNDLIMATGRSDYPNQINNVLGFPFIFRGALDVRAKAINEDMKIAACHALANLAKKRVPDSVCKAYGVDSFMFGREYFIPKPMDIRLISEVSSAVAKAAIDSGVATIDISDWNLYKKSLRKRIEKLHKMKL